MVRRLDQAQKLLPWALALLVCFAFIEGMPAPVEGLYWFNGAMNYLPYFSLAVLNAGLTFGLCFAPQLTRKQRTLYCAAGVVIGFIISGGHQVAGLLINVTAPGTRVRTTGFAGAGFVEAVLKSFVLAALEWVRWLDVPLLCLLVLLALPLRYLAQSSSLSDRVFRHPLAGAAVTFILMWAMIFLPSYTMGGIGAGRLLNVVWMTFILGLAVTEFLLFGWLERIRGVCLTPAIRQLGKAGKRLPLVCAAMLVCMACIGSHTVKEGQDNHFATTLEAAYELADGEAARFAKVLDEREAILTDTDQPDVVIRPLTEEERPWLLFYTDVAPGPDLWGLTPYYSKNSVTIADYNN